MKAGSHKQNIHFVRIQTVDIFGTRNNIAVIYDLSGMLKGVICKKRENGFIVCQKTVHCKNAAAIIRMQLGTELCQPVLNKKIGGCSQ